MTTELIGSKFKRWTVLSFYKQSDGKQFFMCRCDCGTVRPVRKDQLTRGISKSCGCWKSEVCREQIIRISTTHGQANKTRTYGIWKGIRKRCLNKNSASYPRYGGRGITVCERWNEYENFLADMGEAPDNLTLDRIDNNKGYEPSNCRWTDREAQANNTRSNIYFKMNGEILTLKQWCKKLNVPYHRIYQRIFRLGWSFNKAISTEGQKRGQRTIPKT